MPSHPMAFSRAAPYHQSTSTRAITRFDRKPRDKKKTETKN